MTTQRSELHSHLFLVHVHTHLGLLTKTRCVVTLYVGLISEVIVQSSMLLFAKDGVMSKTRELIVLSMFILNSVQFDSI